MSNHSLPPITKSEPCPRCDTPTNHYPAMPGYHADFWHCNKCSVQWSAEELAEAREDAAQDGPYADLMDVYREETSRGLKGAGGGGSGKSRSKVVAFHRDALLVNDWNLGEHTEYAKKSRPLKLETKSIPLSIYLGKAIEPVFKEVCEKGNLKPVEVIRIAMQKKLEKISEIA